MSQQAPRDVARPRTDDRPIWDIVFGVLGYQAIVVAFDLKLYPTLAEQPMTIDEVAATLAIPPRSAEALLSVSAAAGLLQLHEGRYALAPVAEEYLLESSPTYFGNFFEFSMIRNRFTHEFDGMKQTTQTGKALFGGEYDFLEAQEMARTFTRAMNTHSVGPALTWPSLLDLSASTRMLDVGGGSGVHTIAAARIWPHLQGVVFDIAPVCQVAEEFIAEAGIADRVTTLDGDMWEQSHFPSADLHFYSEIYHNWPPDKCAFLTKKSFASLPAGGRIVVHEMLLNDDKVGPFSSAAYSVGMMLWTFGRQFSGSELVAMLGEAGFVEIEVKPSFGYWSIVTGRKPS